MPIDDYGYPVKYINVGDKIQFPYASWGRPVVVLDTVEKVLLAEESRWEHSFKKQMQMAEMCGVEIPAPWRSFLVPDPTHNEEYTLP